MASANEDGIDGVTCGSSQIVSLQEAVTFEVTDDRFNGAAPAQFASDRGGSLLVALRHMDIWRGQTMAPITLIYVNTFNQGSRQAFDLCDLIFQRCRIA